MNNLARNVIIWLIFGAALIGLFNLFQSPSSGQPANELAYSDFVAEVEAQQIDEVLIDGRTLRGESKNGRVITSVMPEDTDIVAVLDKNDVRIVASPDNSVRCSAHVHGHGSVRAVFRAANWFYDTRDKLTGQ